MRLKCVLIFITHAAFKVNGDKFGMLLNYAHTFMNCSVLTLTQIANFKRVV